MSEADEYEGTELSRPIVIRGNENGNGSKITLLLLGTLIAITGFVGAKVWSMSERMARLEANVETLLNQQ